MEELQLELHSKKYRVIDEDGDELGVFRINMADFDFFERSKKAQTYIDGIMTIAKKELSDSGKTTEEKFKKLYELDKKVKGQLDFMFGTNISKIVFGTTNCFSLVGGEPFVKVFLEKFVPQIKKDLLEIQNIKENPKVKKYLDDYKE